MILRRFYAAALALTATTLAPAASAHPHMFVEARSEITINESGRLTGVRTSMLIDELTTLFTLEANGVVSLDAPLTEGQQRAIGDGMVEGLGYYDYFTDLDVDGARLSFAEATVTDVRLEGAQLAATLELRLDAPLDLRGRSIGLALYDPTYFAAVETLAPPSLPDALDACQARLVKFEPTNLDSTTLAALGALSREETPEDERIGARFADRSTITCSG